MQWLPVDTIEVDLLMQRPIDERRAALMAAAFDPDAIGKPFVAAITAGRHTRYLVIDGQHRLRAVQIALGAGQLVECEVVHCDIPTAARLFRQRNTSRLPNAVTDFTVAVTEGDAGCIAINRIVESFGLRIGGTASDRTIKAVVSLRRIYRGSARYGTGTNALALTRTLNTVVRAWGRTMDAFNGDVLLGLGLVILRDGDAIDFPSLERRLAQRKGGALGVLGDARALRQALGGNLTSNVASLIVRECNTGGKKHKIDEWNRRES